MKQFYSFLLMLGVIALLTPTNAYSQSYTYDQSKSSLDVGNPGSYRSTAYDYTTTGGTIIHRGNSGPSGTTGSYNSVNYWSNAVNIPFSFNFYGTNVDSFCVSKNGLLTFSTSVAGSAVNTSLNSNASLPNSNLPDSTIAYFWENMASSISSSDYIYTIPYGSAGSRQLWVLNYSWYHGAASYAYFALVFDEATNDIYMVDMNYFYNSSGSNSMTCGIQLSSSSAVQVNSGLNSSAGSPNIIFGAGGSTYSNNEYYIFEEKLLVTDDIAVKALNNPTGAVCSSSDSIKVEILNDGTNTVSAFDVEWAINGSSQSTYSYSGTLTAGSSVVVNLGSYTYGTGASTLFEFNTSSPNGNSDNNNDNDTLRETLSKGLSGTYSVGSSTSDFTTIAAANAALASSGVCGPVTFNLKSGTYTGQVVLTSASGMSATNTVTWQSDPSNSTMPLLQYDASSTTNNFTLRFQDASFFIVDGLHIKSLDASYCRVVDFDKTNSDIVLQNCKLEGKTVTTSSNYAAVVCHYTNAKGTDITIKDNEVLNGSIGLYLYGQSTTSLASGFVVTGNEIKNFTYYGTYLYYQDAPLYSQNDITTNSTYTSTPYGLVMYYCDGATKVTRNNIHGLPGGYGILSYYCDASSTSMGLIANNFIQVGSGSNWARGLYCGYSSYMRYAHNTCYVTSTSSTTTTSYSAGYFYFSSTSSYPGNRIENNIFANMAGGYALYHYNPSYVAASDGNDIYSTGSGNFIYASSSYSSLSAYQTARSVDANSFSKVPPVMSNSNLHLSDACFDKVPSITSVANDYDGLPRNPAVTHPGADQATQASDDIGVVAILSPSGTVSSGTQTVQIVVKNFGQNSVSGYTASYKVDGGSTISQTSTASLASCALDTLTFTTTFSHTTGCKDMMAWTSSPGGTTDGDASNDSSSSNFGVALSGTFSIGGSSGDFSTFDEALDALNCAGVSGAVVFNVASGTYTGAITLNSLTGLSSTNTVTFQSASSNTTMPVLQNTASSTGDNWTVKFNSTSYFIFDGLHIKSLHTTYGRVFDFTGSNSNITIQNCKLEAPTTTTSSNYMAIIYDWTGTGNMSNDITIQSNTFLNGSMAIYAYGGGSTTLQTGWVITGNTMTNFYYYGVYSFYNGDIEISKNTISSAAYYGIYVYYNDRSTITNNLVSGMISSYGVYMYYCDGTSSSRSVFANNMINVGSGSNSIRGLYAYQCSYQDIHHNTINVSSTYVSSTYATAYIYNSSATYTGTSVMNNIFTNSGGGYAAYYYFSGTTTYLTGLDYNVYDNTGTGSLIYAGGAYASVSAYQTAKSADPNSFEASPVFKSTTDLHLADGCFTKVPSLTTVTTDIDDSTRNTTSTHPGADEVETGALDAGVTEVLAPSGLVTAGNQTVTVGVRNYGTTTLTSVVVNFQIGSGSPQSQTFTVSIPSCTSDTLTFSSPGTHTVGCVQVRAWTSAPNGSTDDVASNDEGSPATIGVPMAAGTFTVGTATSDFATIQDAIDELNCAGIAGPVVFKLATGTYTEQVTLNGIPGVSSTNTVTFTSATGNPSDVKITYSATASTSRHTILFNGADYFMLNGITVEGTGASYAWPMHVMNSKNTSFINCVFRSNYVTSTSTNFLSMVVNSSATSYSTGSGGTSSNMRIDRCSFVNSSYGLTFYGTSTSAKTEGVSITNCTVSNSTYGGFRLYYLGGADISSNIIRLNTSTLAYYPLYMYYVGSSSTKASNITNNQIYNSGYYGIYMSQCDNVSSLRGNMTNNVITDYQGTPTYYGIYNTGSDYWNYYHNTIDMNTGGSGSHRAFYRSSGNYLDIRNNAFHVTNANASTASYAYYSGTSPGSIITLNNNNYYNPKGSYLIYSGGNRLSSVLNTYSTSGDDMSLNLTPNPSSSPTYHYNQEGLFGAGDSTGTMKDIAGASRSHAMPTIGALEINPDLKVISVASDSACGTMNSSATVSVTFKNEGDIIQQMASFNVKLDTNTPVLVSITGPFAKGTTYTRTLPLTLDLSGTKANVITVTHAGGDVDGSDNSASTSVPYWANPVSSFTSKDSCLGDAMSFTNTSSVATNSIVSTGWMFGDGNTASTKDASNTYASNGSYTVTIMSTTSVGCKDTATQSVTVLTALAAGTISGAKTVCYNATSGSMASTGGASGSGGSYQYQWQSSTDNVTFTNVSGATSADYTSGALTQTTYFRRAVTTDVGCGPSYTGSVKITVYDKLVGAVIGSDQNICFKTTPGTISQSAAATGGDGTFTYEWEKSLNGTSWSTISGATTTSYSPGVLSVTTWYRLVAIGGSSCGSIASNAVKILVYNDLYAGLVGNDHSVCPNGIANTMNGTANPSGGDMTYTYQWQTSPDNATWSNISGATSASVSPTASLTATTFYRRNTTSGSSCGTKPTNSVKVVIAPLPNSSFIVANHCFNDVMPVTNNSTVATGSLTGFAWDFGDGNSSATRVPTHVYAASGFKTVKLKVTSNIGCVDSSTNVVNVSNVPTPAFTRVFDCVKEEVLFKNATSVNCGKISAFAWDFGDGSTSAAQNPTHKYATTGTYAVKFKIFLTGGFEDSITRNITIAKKGVSGFTADDECFGDSVRFMNASTNAASYAWDFDDKTSSTLENPVHFYRVAQTYSATLVTTDGNACDDTTTKNVTIKVKPSVYFSTDDRCVNTDKPFNNGTLYAHTYAWTFGDGSSSNSAAKALTHRYTAANTYSVKLVAYNNNGCRDSFIKNVVAYPEPTATFSMANLCEGQAVSATNSSTLNHANHWDMGDGSTFTTTTPTYKYNKAGTYNVTLTVESINGCKDTTRSSVVVYDTPDADFSATNICVGGSTVFTNKSTGGSGTITHSWSFGDGNSSTAANPTHTYSTSGKYTVTLTTTGQGNCAGSVSKTIEVYGAPTATVSVSDVCKGSVSSFTSTTSGAASYAWNFGDGNTSTVQSPKHTYANAGTYTVTLTVASSYGCTKMVTTSTTVNDLPTAGFNNSTVCLGNATSFTNTSSASSGTLSYAWNFGDGSTSTSTSPNHTYSSAGSYSVTLTATANGCSNLSTKTVVVNDVPTADFTTSNSCLGTATNFSNVSGGATKYTWNFGDGSKTSTAKNASHTYTSAGNYTVTLTAENGAGCTDVKTASVTIYGTPTAAFTASNACAGTSVSFTNNSSSGSYVWSFGDGGASTATSPNHTYSTAGNYTVMLTVENGNGCKSTETSQITIYALPTTAFATTSGCEKAGIQFTNNTAGTNTYAWTFGDAGTSTAKNPSHTYASAGSFSVSLTATNGNGCSNRVTRTVVVSPQPKVTFTANSPCEGSAVNFSNSSTQGANNWTLGDGATSRLTNPNHNYTSAGTYSVKLTVTTAAGCTNSMTNNVTVNPNPLASFTSKALCTGPNVDFTNTSTIGGGSITSSQWNYGDASVGTSNSHTYAKAGVYNVTLMVTSDRGCMTSSTSPVAVYAAPTAKFSSTDVCLGQSAKFTNESSNASSVSWAFGDGGSSNATNPTHLYGSASSYTVTLTASNAIGCDNSTTGTVVVSNNPTAAFTASSGCEGLATKFTNSSTGSSSSSWSFGDGTISTDNNPSHAFASSGNKTVTLIVRNAAGCSDEVTNSVLINTSPTATFTATGNCLGDETMFSNTSQNGTTFAWSFGDGNSSTNPNAVNTYAATGDYRVLLIVSNTNCVDSIEQVVSINPLPTSDFTHTTSGREVSFSPIELGGTSYNWNFADGNTSTSISPVHRFATAVVQTYNVCLTLTDKAGCTSEKCNDVNVDLVGVNDVDAINAFNVYPNPNTGSFVVTMGEINGAIEIMLYDTKGVLVAVVDTTKPTTQFDIDVTGVSEGVYFVHVKNGDYTSTQKVVITK